MGASAIYESKSIQDISTIYENKDSNDDVKDIVKDIEHILINDII
jgi:hypothetical protein